MISYRLGNARMPAVSASVYGVVCFDYYFHQFKLCNI